MNHRLEPACDGRANHNFPRFPPQRRRRWRFAAWLRVGLRETLHVACRTRSKRISPLLSSSSSPRVDRPIGPPHVRFSWESRRRPRLRPRACTCARAFSGGSHTDDRRPVNGRRFLSRLGSAGSNLIAQSAVPSHQIISNRDSIKTLRWSRCNAKGETHSSAFSRGKLSSIWRLKSVWILYWF